ncbi:MAG: heme-binding domain-containing protein [Chloroflexi bacterium]|nr:heme-binding domain-containing protein [Chloroflexota bacterium]
MGGLVLGGRLVFVAIQFIPYGRDHTNPPVQSEPNWGSPQTRALAVRACFDCHSNQSVWPWYSNIAPISWLIQRDVDQGRRRLNFSEWNGFGETRDVTRVVQRGEMPQWYYVLIHPQANLSPSEKVSLVEGLGSLSQR